MMCTIGKWVGFCSGVQRAIKGAEKALEENSVIYCLGEIIHNPTHRLVANLRKEGYNLIIVGNPHHPEVKAIRSLSGSSAQVIERVQEVKGASFAEKNAVVVQTTFNPQSFSSIVSEVIRRTYKTLVCTTLCEETIKRQTEAVELAGKVDFMIVVGGKNSSNTKTLCNIVEGRVRVAHIEDADEIDTLGLHHVHRIGIISGASTPVEEVRKVYKKLQGYSQ